MLVKDRMNKEVVTVPPSTTVLEAEKIMKDKNIRRLPVVEKGELVGIVTYNDLLEASPSKATTLSRFEITYLLSKMSVAEIMTREVIYTKPDTPIEEAALIMNKNQIGGLPVVEAGRVVGIITESDIFEILVETLGVREGGTRLTLELPQRPGVLHEVTGVIREYGVNILSLATFYQDQKPDYRYVVMRLATREPEKIIEELNKNSDVNVCHVWITPEEE
ncbi:MAG TPA: CBS and ACT domain-containing protein [Candidatus Atribacteria bacterium]|nr:CBS and ACT domain-containing protein [Candidatus Atribacteria bacterium]